MTPKELVVLASKLGAITFYGIPDPFRGMSRAEIKAALPQIQHQAEQRGLATMGFDLSFSVNTEAAEIISACTMCDGYLTVDAVIDGVREPREVLYRSDCNSILLRDEHDVITLQKVSADEVQDTICRKYLSKQRETIPQGQDFRMLPSLLGELRTMECGGTEKLQACGSTPEMAETILQGLSGKCLYLSVVNVDLQKKNCASLLLVISDIGMVRLRLENDAGTDFCYASWIGKQEAQAELAKLFQRA